MHRKRVLLILGLLLGIAALIALNFDRLQRQFFEPTESSAGNGVTAERADEDIMTVAEDLTVPWGMARLPGGDLLVTERSGTLRRIGQDSQSYPIAGVERRGEGGLMGLALDPGFADNNRIYMYLTTRSGNALTNRIESYAYKDDALSDRRVLLENIPGASYHDGGRLAFGPDGYLYATTGDAGDEQSAQNTGSLAGKILRLTKTGEPAPGNPFGNHVYSYGHRNPQGLAWDSQGRLWSTEHGRSGVRSGFDELNRIRPGANYGWPIIEGDETQSGMERPVLHSGADETWAPASLAYADGRFFFAGLRGQSLYEVRVPDNGEPEITAHFRKDYGRLRSVLASGEQLYVSTSNTDGRGNPAAGDDRILRMPLSVFGE